MSEAKEQVACLPEVEEETFVRFSQFAYTGDYESAAPDIMLDSSQIDATHVAGLAGSGGAPAKQNSASMWSLHEPDAPPEPIEEAPRCSSPEAWEPVLVRCGRMSNVWHPIGPQGKRAKRSQMWWEFKSKVYAVWQADHPAYHFSARPNRESREDYTPVFLCHAQLYVFADQYGIRPLRVLALYKLHRTLVTFTPYRERVGDIVELVRYTYANTKPTVLETDSSGVVHGPPPDPLKDLVTRYVVCVVEDLAGHAEFDALLEEGGPFASYLVERMVKRLD